MKVYILWLTEQWEADQMLGIFSSEENAERYKERYTIGRYQCLTIEDYELDTDMFNLSIGVDNG